MHVPPLADMRAPCPLPLPPNLRTMVPLLPFAALAILHNDDAVLERFHVSSAYMVASQPGCEVFRWMPLETQRRVRSLVIPMVLATVRVCVRVGRLCVWVDMYKVMPPLLLFSWEHEVRVLAVLPFVCLHVCVCVSNLVCAAISLTRP